MLKKYIEQKKKEREETKKEQEEVRKALLLAEEKERNAEKNKRLEIDTFLTKWKVETYDKTLEQHGINEKTKIVRNGDEDDWNDWWDIEERQDWNDCSLSANVDNKECECYQKLFFDPKDPSESSYVRCIKCGADITRCDVTDMTDSFYYIWKSNGCLNFFPKLTDRFPIASQFSNRFTISDEIFAGRITVPIIDLYFQVKSIPIDDIECFGVVGEHYRETLISGGGGGGTSLGGAIIGGMIAGGVGAIIGSRNETNSIESETIVYDDRKVVLTFFESDERQVMEFGLNYLQILEDLIPEKNYDIAQEIKKRKIVEQQSGATVSITDKIRELSKLKDDGILTEEEFATKKSELLAKM